MDMPAAFQEGLKVALQGPPILEQHCDDGHFLAIVAEVNRAPWWKMLGKDTFAAPRTGSRPGMPPASDTFNMLFSTVIGNIEQDLSDEGLALDLQPLITQPRVFARTAAIPPMATASFVDDLTAKAAVDHPEQVTAKAQRLIKILHNRIGPTGLKVNFSMSVLLITFSGKGYKKHELLTKKADAPAITTEGGQSFRVVRVHKSLGTHLTDNGSWGSEVAARIAAMRSGIGPIRRTFGKNREGPRTKS
eukprot:7965879-Pyramimonas_sp.AAC.1